MNAWNVYRGSHYPIMKAHLFSILFCFAFPSLRNATPAPEAWQAEALRLLNEARTHGCNCGYTHMPAVAPLTFSLKLSRVAKGHAQYLETKNAIGHRGRGGTRVGQRAAQAGYRWRYIGENIAMGYPGTAANVAAWLGSPGHCSNIMDAHYTEMGIARAGSIYVLVLASP